jgi:hypothetical protein
MKMEETKGFKMHKNRIGKNNTREKREKTREREENKRVM